MRRVPFFALVIAVLVVAPVAAHAQEDPSRVVADGGILVPGWQGRIDGAEAEKGYKLENAKLARAGDALRVTTGPAVTYWNPANRAQGNYTVSATFREDEYMALNNHPHPYGIVIAGHDMGTDQQSFLYCTAYGNGRFIVRGFGPAPFHLNGPRPTQHDAVNVAPGRGQPVTQEIAVSVRNGKVECAINGTVVASYDRAEVVGEGKLKATDGIWGIRFAHNTDAVVTNLKVTQH